MLKSGTIFGDIVETFKDEGGKAVKEIARVPVDIVKASFEQPIPNPSEQRQEQLESTKNIKLAAIRSNLRSEAVSMGQKQEQPQTQRGEQIAERGQKNQMAALNNSQGPQPLSANITPKKKIEPLVVQQKRNNKLHGAG